MPRLNFISLFLLSITLSCSGQIQVSQEPRHHKVFENRWVRVLDVHVPPGDTTMIHKHSTPSVFIVLTSTRTGSQVIVEPAELRLTQGNIWFEGFYNQPRIHRVWNSDTSEFHVMDIELPNKQLQAIDPPLAIPGFQLLFDEKPVRGYRVRVNAGDTLTLGRRKAPMLLVRVSKSPGKLSVNRQEFAKPGDFVFIEGGGTTGLINIGAATQELALFELK